MKPLALHPRSSVLDNIEIATPCHAKWEDMLGDERVRFCGSCAKHVYNISAMQREEAIGLIQETEGRTCIRLFRRADGTVLVQDCPVGLAQRAAQRAKRVGMRALALAVALVSVCFGHMGRRMPESLETWGTVSQALPDDAVVMGEMMPEPEVDVAPAAQERPRLIMGRIKAMSPQKP